MLIEKQNRIRDKNHRRLIATLPCLTTGLEGSTQADHVSEGRFSMGMKAGDDNCVPLSYTEHAYQHQIGESNYWSQYGGIARVRTLAKALYKATGDEAEATYLIRKWRNENSF